MVFRVDRSFLKGLQGCLGFVGYVRVYVSFGVS